MQWTWSFLRHEPLVQFALAAAMLFALYGAVSPPEDAIQVTAEMAEELIADREMIQGRRLTTTERQDVITAFIDEEVMVREALARGFAARDGKVRQRLVNKMLFLFDEEPPAPSAEELDAFYQSHAERYRSPPSISFEHAFFATAPAAPRQVVEALTAGAPPESLGDRFWLGGTFARITAAELAVSFGAGLAEALTALPPGAWHGPLPSSRGTHFVRVTAHHEAQIVARENLSGGLRQDWIEDWRRQARQQQVLELRQRYRVVGEIQEDQG